MSFTEGRKQTVSGDNPAEVKIPLEYLDKVAHSSAGTIDMIISQAEEATGRPLTNEEYEALLEIWQNENPI